jgi:hypothetical protein
MFSLTEKALSPQSKQQLSATASYHGSLLKMRLHQVMKATGVFAGLLFVIAGVPVYRRSSCHRQKLL